MMMATLAVMVVMLSYKYACVRRDVPAKEISTGMPRTRMLVVVMMRSKYVCPRSVLRWW